MAEHCGDDSEEKRQTDPLISSKATKRKGVLLLGGSFSPCHTEHVELLNAIKQYVEKEENFLIVAAYLVITTDQYVANKLGPNAISFNYRFKMCTLTASKY